jgi:hypothetical protein
MNEEINEIDLSNWEATIEDWNNFWEDNAE